MFVFATKIRICVFKTISVRHVSERRSQLIKFPCVEENKLHNKNFRILTHQISAHEPEAASLRTKQVQFTYLPAYLPTYLQWSNDATTAFLPQTGGGHDEEETSLTILLRHRFDTNHHQTAHNAKQSSNLPMFFIPKNAKNP